MKLTLSGHDDRYAVEQLQMSLFPADSDGEAISSLHRGGTWLTATAKITLNGKTATASRRLKASQETVRLRRRILQQSFYLAACQLLPVTPPWGALAGVRPTKITTTPMLEGGSPKSAGKLLPFHRQRGEAAGTGGSVPLCRHPLLPHPLHLLQLRQPHHRQKDRAVGALSGGTSERN